MSASDAVEFETAHLETEIALPDGIDGSTFPDLYVGLEIDLLGPGDGIVTDRHHASASRYEADDPQNQIACQISPFTLSGWLRHGCEQIHQIAGASACHPGETNANFMLEDGYNRDLESGYHEKGSCVDGDYDMGCVIYDLFGGFGDRAGRVIRRPIQLRQATRDVVGSIDGTWRLTLRELKPEYIGLLVEAVDHLNAQRDVFELQLNGTQNFAAGIVDAQIINPIYTDDEVRRVFDRTKAATAAMASKDDIWRENVRQQFVRALHERVAAIQQL